MPLKSALSKILLIITVTLLSTVNLRAHSKSDTVRLHDEFGLLLFRPLSLVDGTVVISYEHKFPHNTMLRITPSIVLGTGLLRGGDRSGFGIDLGYKIFLQKKFRKRRGNYYIGPYFMYKHMERAVNATPGSTFFGGGNAASSSNINVYGMGIDNGFKFFFGRFVMDLTWGIGIRYPVLSNKNFKSYDSSFPSSDDYKGIMPRIQYSIGMVLQK